VGDEAFPSTEDDVERLRNRYRAFCAEDLDVPSTFVTQANNKEIWLDILSAAFPGQRIVPSSKETISVGPVGSLPGRAVHHALFFRGPPDSEIVLLVGLTRWVWANRRMRTYGHYSRMRLLVLRRGEKASKEDEGENPKGHEVEASPAGTGWPSSSSDGTGIYESHESHEVCDGESDQVCDSVATEYVTLEDFCQLVLVGDGGHYYSSDAHHPETLWSLYGRHGDPETEWAILHGNQRPGSWVHLPNPCFTARKERMHSSQWVIASVQPVEKSVHFERKFMLDIYSHDLFLHARRIESEGSKNYARDNEAEMHLFLTTLYNVFEHVLREARINIYYENWSSKPNWVDFGELDEDRFLPLTLRYPGCDGADSGPELTVRIRSGVHGVLHASTMFDYLGETGPSFESVIYPHPEAQHVEAARHYLGPEGCSEVRMAMRRIMNPRSTSQTVSFSPPEEWAAHKLALNSQRPWEVGYDLHEPDALGQALLLLAASAYSKGQRITSASYLRPPAGARDQRGLTWAYFRPCVYELKVGERTLMRVLFECERAEYDSNRELAVVVSIRVEPGDADRPAVGGGNFRLDILKDYLRASSICTDHAAALIAAFNGGGQASLKTFYPWHRSFYMIRSDELDKRISNLIDFLCLLTKCDLSTSETDRGPRLDTRIPFGVGICHRSIQTKATWNWKVQPFNRPAKEIGISLCPDKDQHLVLRFEVSVQSAEAESTEILSEARRASLPALFSP